MDRAHRIGQKKEVQVFRFAIDNSIEEKVIEKAYKKLRLDALVIQQGRLTENTKGVNKDDLLAMVRYGAEKVFAGGGQGNTVTDEDIDAIIAKGEQETHALNSRLQEYTENAMKFTMDGGLSAYEYRDPDAEQTAAEGMDYKALIGNNWIDPPKRERKRIVNYSENEAFRQAMKASGGGRQSGPRLPKMPQMQDFQFFDVTRLTEIYNKENAYEVHKHQLAQREAAARAQGASDEVVAAEIAPGPDDPQPLSEEEIAERDRLLETGFSNWNRRDFNAFVRAAEKYGRTNLGEIASEVDGKSEDDVRAYSEVFWKRYEELNDWERVIKNIERGEQRIQRQADIMAAIASKLDRYRNPWQELKIAYGANKGKAYTEEEDRFIVCMVHQLGYGAWDELKAQVRQSWRFRFDWFFKSRTPQELQRRCDTLIRLVEKENEEYDAKEASDRKKGGAKTPAASKASKATADGGGSAARKRKPAASGGGSAAKRRATAGAS